MTAERRLLYWTIGIAVFLTVLYLLRAVMLPFVAGMAIAYFLDPLTDKLEKIKVPRALAAILLIVLFFLAFAAFFLLLAPVLQAQLLNLIANLPRYTEMLRETAIDVLAIAQAKLSPEQIADLKSAVSGIAKDTIAWLGSLLKGLVSGGVALFNLLSLLLITPIVAFYLLRDWDRIVAKVDHWIPRGEAATIREQICEIDRTLSAFVRGQATVCLSLGALYGIGLTLIGLDFGLVIGIATGLISFVPIFGTIVGGVISIGLAIVQFNDWQSIALVAGLFVAGQILEGYVLTPNLVGDRVGLHPVWVIFALLAGGALFDFVGVLLAVPAAATIGVVSRFAISRYLGSGFYSHGGDGPGPASEDP